MKLATWIYQGRPYVGVVRDHSVMIPAFCEDWSYSDQDLLAVIEAGPHALSALRELTERIRAGGIVELDAVRLVAPLPRPRKNIMCLGWNYADPHWAQPMGGGVSLPNGLARQSQRTADAIGKRFCLDGLASFLSPNYP